MIDSPKDKSMKFMALGALLVMFILGAAVGIVLDNWYHRTHPQLTAGPAGPRKDGRDRRPGPPGDRPGGPDRFFERLQKELSLTDQQAKQMREIMTRTQDQFMQLRTESRPKYVAIREQSEKEIKAILSPEQQAKLDAFFKQGDRDRGDREHGDRDHDRDKEGSQRPH